MDVKFELATIISDEIVAEKNKLKATMIDKLVEKFCSPNLSICSQTIDIDTNSLQTIEIDGNKQAADALHAAALHDLTVISSENCTKELAEILKTKIKLVKRTKQISHLQKTEIVGSCYILTEKQMREMVSKIVDELGKSDNDKG